jgi:hypothetical protein
VESPLNAVDLRTDASRRFKKVENAEIRPINFNSMQPPVHFYRKEVALPAPAGED